MKNSFVPCRKCYGKNGNYAPGFIIEKVQIDPAKYGKDYVETVRECQCHIDYTNKISLAKRYEKNGGNKSFIDYDFNKDYIASSDDKAKIFINKYLDNYLKSFKVRSAIVWFYGKNGTQKTTASYYILREVLAKRFKAQYILMNNLVKLLMKAERDEESKQTIDLLSEVDLLIIDEAFMKSKMTLYSSNYQIPFIDTFIRDRCNKNKGIIFISNIEETEIASQGFSKDIQDFITREVSLNKSKVEFTSNYLANTSIPSEGMFA